MRESIRKLATGFVYGAGVSLLFFTVRSLFVRSDLGDPFGSLWALLLLYTIGGGVAGFSFAATSPLRRKGGCYRVLSFFLLGQAVGIALVPFGLLNPDTSPSSPMDWFLYLAVFPVGMGLLGIFSYLYARAIGHID